jgi:hypothetical protein
MLLNATPEPAHAEDPVAKATGRSADSWFERLDQWGAAQRTHTEIARWLAEQPGVSSWWAQSVTVSYEQARGRRQRYQRPDGFTALGGRRSVRQRQRRIHGGRHGPKQLQGRPPADA